MTLGRSVEVQFLEVQFLSFSCYEVQFLVKSSESAGDSSFKGFCPGTGETCQRGDPPLTDLKWVASIASNFASFRSYPKSFRIWSFQTDVTSRFQGCWLKLSHLGEIFVQSWKYFLKDTTFDGFWLSPVSCLFSHLSEAGDYFFN